MSIIEEKYFNGDTELNKFKFKPSITYGDPPLVTKRIPTEQNSSRPENNAFTKRADDLARISQLFGRREGIQFTSNNIQLNSAVDLSYTVQGSLQDKLTALKDINRTQNTTSALQTIVSTLAQVPVSGTGTHFIKGRLFGKPKGPEVSKTTENIGDPGKVVVKYGRDSIFETAPYNYGEDKVNAISPYTGESVKAIDDYIKFYFEVLRPGEAPNVFLHFRAFLDNFNDSYNGNWNSFNYIGRGETMHTYQSFDRSINVSFKSAVATKQELAPVYQKLAYLASTTAPTYSRTAELGSTQTGGIMRGTIVRMNIGDYLHDTAGYISNVTYNWESNFPFEIKKEVPEDSFDQALQELPHMLQCSLTFTPIHAFTPQTGLHHYITNPRLNEEIDPIFRQPDKNYSGGVETIPNSRNNR